MSMSTDVVLLKVHAVVARTEALTLLPSLNTVYGRLHSTGWLGHTGSPGWELAPKGARGMSMSIDVVLLKVHAVVARTEALTLLPSLKTVCRRLHSTG